MSETKEKAKLIELIYSRPIIINRFFISIKSDTTIFKRFRPVMVNKNKHMYITFNRKNVRNTITYHFKYDK